MRQVGFVETAAFAEPFTCNDEPLILSTLRVPRFLTPRTTPGKTKKKKLELHDSRMASLLRAYKCGIVHLSVCQQPMD